MHNCLFNYLTENNLIYANQSGFRRKYSTETALIRILDSILFNLDRNKVTGMVTVDYKKAFDMVDHALLIRKLEVYRLDSQALSWFTSYLSDRKQFVTFKGQCSDVRTVTAGVPQGSILGPLLFVMFINDLHLQIDAQVDLFADDTTLTSSADYTCIDKLSDKLSSEVASVNEWAIQNKLPLNSSKTKSMLFTGKRLMSKGSVECSQFQVTLEGTHLKQVDNLKLLGLEIDKDLTFDKHIEVLSKKLSKRIAILNKIKSYLPRSERILFYNSMIKSIMMYCSTLWTGSGSSQDNINRIFKMQKRCARVILNADSRHSSVDLFNKLSWLPCFIESDIKRCVLAFKRLHNNVPDYINNLLKLNSEQHRRSTRNAHIKFVTPRYVREREGGKTFSVVTSKLWNKLPIKLRSSPSLRVFKKGLRNIFLDFQTKNNIFPSFDIV